VLASTCWLCCGAHGIFVSILSNDWWVIDAYGKIKEMEKRKACDCSHAILLSSFLLLFFFFFLNNKSSSPQFSFMCRGQVWSTLPYKLLILIMYSLKLDQSNSFQFSFCDWLWSHPCFCLLLCFFHNGWETRIFLLFYDHQYIGINLNVKSKSILFLNEVKN